jgi:hypothetical protein
MENPEGLDRETVDDALDVLQDIVLWELTAPRWEQVGQILDRLGAAIAVADREGLRAAVADLELSGPTRALRIGGTGTRGIPEPVFDRRNNLVHSLGQEKAKPPAEGGSSGRPTR